MNRADALFRADRYIESPQLPSGLGLEVAGEIDCLGTDVSGFAMGDAVSVIPPVSMRHRPAYAEQVVFPAEFVVRHPGQLGWVEAAALWMPFLTAYGGLCQTAGLSAGEHVVITAASSSVGLAAIQIARSIGAVPIAVTRSATKREALLRHGAERVIVTEHDDLLAALQAIAQSDGVRVVFDAIGGPQVEVFAAAMPPGGIMIVYGALSAEGAAFPHINLLSKSLTLRGFLVHEVTLDRDRLEQAKSFILSGVASGELTPTIARTFDFDEVVEAHRYLEANQQFGKIVLTVP